MQRQSFDPWIKFSLVIALAAVAAWNPSLISHRLPPTGRGIPSVGIQDVPARLWQDPFNAVAKYKKDKCGNGVGQQDAAPCKQKDLDWLHTLILQRASGRIDNTVNVIYVLISGGDRVGADEARRRTRYAILAGLAAGEYSARDPEHIGYINATIPDDSISPVIPFEWMDSGKPQTSPPILLLWINEDALQQERSEKPAGENAACSHIQPLARLEAIIHTLTQPTTGAAGRTATIHSIVVGPSSSSFFMEVAQELSDADRCQGSDNSRMVLGRWKEKHISWYSPLATIPDTVFQVSGRGDKYKTVKDVLNYRRLIIDDKELLDGLIRELYERLHDQPGASRKILLVGQWDTAYSRQLVTYFKELLTRYCNQSGDKRPLASKVSRMVIVKNYLRGIDGVTAERGEASLGEKESDNGTSNIIEKVASQSDRPEGDPQVDYLRRLGKEVTERAENEKFNVAAVGILGDDYHDKLLALEELRSVFPQAVFFTTDLDAAMFYHFDNRYTRNLLVASNYGLYLRPEIQKDIPPFRDSYQTAAFLAIRVALDDIRSGGKNRISDETLATWRRPHIFEIGRTEPVYLRPAEGVGNPSNGAGDSRCESLNSCADPNPSWTSHPGYGIISLCIVTVIVAFTVLYYRASMGHTRGAWISFLWILSLVPILLYFLYRYTHQGGVQEPMDLLQGVSIWPSELIRLLAVFLGLGLLFRGRSGILQSAREMAATYQLKAPASVGFMELLKSPFRSFNWRKGQELSVLKLRSLDEVWDCYQGRKWHKSQPYIDRYGIAARLIIKTTVICLLVATIFIVGLTAFNLCPPVAPARGEFAYRSDLLMLLLTLLVFFTLAAYTIDWLVRGIWMVNSIRSGEASLQFPRARLLNTAGQGEAGDPPGKDNDSIRHYYWRCGCFIGKATEPIQRLVFYSFSVWILFIFSRSHLFDGWHTPAFLYVVFSMYAALIVMPAIILRYCSEKFRSDAVNWLNERMIALKKGDALLQVKQLENIRDQIAQLKTGAFAPFSQQPLVEAAMALVGSFSGLILLEQYIPF